MKILTVSQMKKAEQDCSQFGISLDQLMENAGKAVAEETSKILGKIEKKSVLILIGPGNNGGDGLVAARHLHDWGTLVRIYLCTKRPHGDTNLQKARQRGINCVEASEDEGLCKLRQWLLESNAVLDAIFGTGTGRPLTGIFARVLELTGEAKIKRPTLRIIALDLPSGVNADTGTVDPVTPYADNTIALGFPKTGLFNLPASERIGVLSIVDIGIPPQLVNSIQDEYLTASNIGLMLPKRPLVSNKGTFGKVLALVGSVNYSGAAYLACSGAIRVGAGLTTLAIVTSLVPVLAARLTEVTYLPLPESSCGTVSRNAAELIRQNMHAFNVLLVGCGLGQNSETVDLVEGILLSTNTTSIGIVLDADGLNVLAGIPDWPGRFTADVVFTPHPGEMSRLIKKPVEQIQTNRLASTLIASREWNKTIVLKGAYTVIASPEGLLRVSPFANSGLASAGTGDVLAGVIAGMLAQGLSPFNAACCGVYLHGLAGEIIKAEIGDAGMLASDLLPALPKAIRQLKAV